MTCQRPARDLDFLKALPAIPGRVIPIRQLELFLAAPSNLLALLPSSSRQLGVLGSGAAAQAGVGAEPSPDRWHSPAGVTNGGVIKMIPFPEDSSHLGRFPCCISFSPRGKSKFSLGQAPFSCISSHLPVHHQSAAGIKEILTNLTAAPSWNFVTNTSFP